MGNIKNFNNYISNTYSINEEGEGGGGGQATATASTTTGMGDVTSAQPASTPGEASTGDGTTGSGDIGIPLFKTAEKDGGRTLGKKDKKKKKSAIAHFVSKQKKNAEDKSNEYDEDKSSSKVMSFTDFTNNDIKK